ncbi:MAG: class I SAM-dependent methyltransferase [Anaerolineales bacterium]|nr:class I SAM-dependent methyltransferase [Anaerolineales bacterium]
MPGKIFFTLKYLLNNPPWDTGITPPEVITYLEKYPPGRALDLGCGTGTNVLTIASYGWQVTGIDYIPRAIRTARRKARRADLTDRVDFQVGDVLDLSLEDQYDLILDIGCFHSIFGANIHRYVRNVYNHLSTGGNLLLYAHLRMDSSPGHGSSEEDLTVLANALSLIHRQDGEEGSSRASAWFRFQKVIPG